jgi:hypothetical protein
MIKKIPALAFAAVLAQPAEATSIGDAILAGIATHAIISVIRGPQPQPLYVPPVIMPSGAYHPIIVAPNHDPRVYRPQQQLPVVTRDSCRYNGDTVMVYGQNGQIIGYQICP